VKKSFTVIVWKAARNSNGSFTACWMTEM